MTEQAGGIEWPISALNSVVCIIVVSTLVGGNMKAGDLNK